MTILNINLFAAMSNDEMVKKQCQYDIYGNGQTSSYAIGKMMGIIDGIMYMTSKEDKEDIIATATFGIISDKACQNALNNISEYGFYEDYKWELTKLLSKKF